MGTRWQRIRLKTIGPTGTFRPMRRMRPLGEAPTRRERIVRGSLVAGAVVLALLLLLATCGGPPKDTKGGRDGKSTTTGTKATMPSPSGTSRIPQLPVPAAYDTARGWDIIDGSPTYAIAEDTGLVAYLSRTDDDRYLIRTVDPATGKPGWNGEPRRTLFPADRFPRLLTVTTGDNREFFVTWSYGRINQSPGQPSDAIISLDIYSASDGSARRVEIPWADAPKVTASGPGLLITDGKATSAVVDPVTGEAVSVPPGALGYPKGCKECRKLTQVRGTTDKGLLVSGAKEFWVRGGWYSRKVAPKDTDAATGVPASTAGGYILATWQKKKSAKDARTHEVWALHDAATGKAVLQVRCRKPAITPADDPQLVISPQGNYLVAGRLAFDLEEKRAFCFEEEDGTRPLTLATVADDGTAYGARSARSAADALAGGGSAPVTVDLATATPETLARNVRLPGAEIAGVGLFRWTDGRDRSHLTGYPHRDNWS
ncbi:hypothetical protein ACIQVO_16880 [Streptomyces sp. NPDC101062]|uniref:hypothetical protein n=2 Tax=unclassified Streptomyces TaxID=2593676 RepID=UPI003801BDEF